MKNKLPIFSLIFGVAIWVISVADIAYLNLYHSVETQAPNSIFKPGAFESLVIILLGFIGTSCGLLAGIISLKISKNKSLAWAAIAVNAFYCIPVAAMLALQAFSR